MSNRSIQAALPADQLDVSGVLCAGRAIHYDGGYGDSAGSGAIVGVIGEPGRVRPTTSGWTVLGEGCCLEIVLADGRRFPDVRQQSLVDGLSGFQLGPQTLSADEVRTLKVSAAARLVEDQLEGVRARSEFIRSESLRIVGEAPVFAWNGVKDHPGREGRLHRVDYSFSDSGQYPVGTVLVRSSGYEAFSHLVRNVFAVGSEYDPMNDACAREYFVVIPQHPLHSKVCEAAFARWERAGARVN